MDDCIIKHMFTVAAGFAWLVFAASVVSAFVSTEPTDAWWVVAVAIVPACTTVAAVLWRRHLRRHGLP